MTDTPAGTSDTPASITDAPAATSGTPGHAAGRARSGSARLPSPAALLVVQLGYQIRLLLFNGRAVAVGIGLPVILMLASKGSAKDSHPNVAGWAVFGLTITAWTTYGVRLVAAREDGVLKRWRATPLPSWCYFVAAICATTLVAVLAGAVTVGAGAAFYGRHFDDGAAVDLTVSGILAVLVALVLAAFAWAATATALTSVIPTVDAAFPILILTYFPLVIISGVMFSISEPHWLSSAASYLPAEPLIDAVTRAVRHAPGAPFLDARDMIVLACWAVGGLLAAILVFRWQPHRPAQRRPARNKT
jgi:ABC-2 type transport system permease protein